jgi:hypothetical protein
MATIEQTTMKVQRILTGPMQLNVQVRGDTMAIHFADTSTQVTFHVSELGKDRDGNPRTVVRVSAPILWGVAPTPALYEWIAREGGNYVFGHVAAFNDGSEPGKVFLLMTHTLLGDYLDEDELAAAMWAVLGSADDLDDELRQRFGGKRYIDA